MDPLPPAWLLKDEDYAPAPDRDHFIDRSITALLRVLSGLRASAEVYGGLRLNPGVKLASTLLFVLLASLSRSGFFMVLAAAVLLALLALQPARRIAKTLRTSLPAACLALLIMLPSALWGNLSGSLRLALKVFLSVAAMRLLTLTTRSDEMTGALKVLRVPDIFVLVLDITIRSIAMLGELSLAMLYAVRLRSVGRNRGKAASLAGIAGTLFLKSREMAEEVYAAMECRLFTGRYTRRAASRLSPADIIPAAIDAVLLGVFLLVEA